MTTATQRRRAMRLLVVAAMLALSACTGGGGSKAAAPALARTAWRAAAYDDVGEGGTLRLAVAALPANWNALNANDGYSSTFDLEAPLVAGYQGLGLTVDDRGVPAPDPMYITSAKVVSTDPQIVEVKLNPKGVWSDGSAITWRDYRSFARAMSGRDSRYEAFSTDGYDQIASVTRGADEYTYRVRFSRPNADWLDLIYPELPSAVTSTPQAFNTGYENRMYPSAGPFVVQSVDRTAGVVTEVPNPRWWGRRPKLDKIIFRVVDESSSAQAFTSGELDAVDTDASRDVLAAARRRAGSVVQRAGGLASTLLCLNGTSGPLKNVHVRRAVAHAIDRQTMATVLAKGLGTPAVTVGSVVFLPGQEGYADSAGNLLSYSRAAVARELRAAGYEKKSGHWVRDGKRLTLSITIPADTATSDQRGELVAGFLRDVGIVPKLVTVAGERYFTDYIAKRKFELMTYVSTGAPFPVSTAEPLFTPADSPDNFSGISDTRLAGLWADANAELSASAQISLVRRIDRVIFGFVPVVPLNATPNVLVVRRDLANYGAAQFRSVDWTSVGYVK